MFDREAGSGADLTFETARDGDPETGAGQSALQRLKFDIRDASQIHSSGIFGGIGGNLGAIGKGEGNFDKLGHGKLDHNLNMDLQSLGDSAFILRNLGETPAHLVAAALRSRDWPGIQDVNSAFHTVGIYVDPLVMTPARLAEIVSELEIPFGVEGRHHLIPCCYELGEDLTEVASLMRMETADVICLHSGRTYKCEAIGFSPGFPYLSETAEQFWAVGRLAQPRVSVPAGSVAVAGRQAAVYPSATPGGWRLLGRTPLQLVDVAEDYFPIAAGDTVSFVAISMNEYEDRLGERL